MIDNISPRLVQRIRHKLVTNDHRIMIAGKYYNIKITPIGKCVNYDGHLFYRLNSRAASVIKDRPSEDLIGDNFMIV